MAYYISKFPEQALSMVSFQNVPYPNLNHIFQTNTYILYSILTDNIGNSISQCVSEIVFLDFHKIKKFGQGTYFLEIHDSLALVEEI